MAKPASGSISKLCSRILGTRRCGSADRQRWSSVDSDVASFKPPASSLKPKIMNLEIFKDADKLSVQLAEWITSLIEETLTRKEQFSLVLSGGNTPKKLHLVLASSPYKERIDWKKIHVFWGDERAVPLEDERNNA